MQATEAANISLLMRRYGCLSFKRLRLFKTCHTNLPTLNQKAVYRESSLHEWHTGLCHFPHCLCPIWALQCWNVNWSEQRVAEIFMTCLTQSGPFCKVLKEQMKAVSKLRRPHPSADWQLQRMHGWFLRDNAAMPLAYRVKLHNCACFVLLMFLATFCDWKGLCLPSEWVQDKEFVLLI